MPCSGCLERFGDYLAENYNANVTGLRRVDGQFWFTYSLDDYNFYAVEYGIDYAVNYMEKAFHGLYLDGIQKYEDLTIHHFGY